MVDSGQSVLKKKERNYGVDLLRIVAMFFVVVLHVSGKGGLLSATKGHGFINAYVWILEAVAFCGVNCYALISGYVGINSKYKLSNIVYLWLQVVFYSVGITVIFSLTGLIDFKLSSLQSFLLPVTYGRYWYFCAYFTLFLFMPILNYGVNNAPRKTLKYVILIILTIVTVFPTLFNEEMITLCDGKSPLWLIILYVVGGYIKKYDCFENVKTKVVLAVLICFTAITCLSKFAIEFVTALIVGEAKGDRVLLSYLAPNVFIIAVCLLILFSRIKFNKKPAIVSFVAPLTFGVYLIHEHPAVIDVFIKDRFIGIVSLNPLVFAFAVLGICLAVFICSAIIDYVRLALFNLLRVRKILNKTEEKIKTKLR